MATIILKLKKKNHPNGYKQFLFLGQRGVWDVITNAMVINA